MSDLISRPELEAAAERLARVQARVDAACGRAGRDPAETTIVGACKRQPVERIAAAVIAGVDELGENYVQGARDMQPALAAALEPYDVAPPRWRMIGRTPRRVIQVRAGLTPGRQRRDA